MKHKIATTIHSFTVTFRSVLPHVSPSPPPPPSSPALTSSWCELFCGNSASILMIFSNCIGAAFSNFSPGMTATITSHRHRHRRTVERGISAAFPSFQMRACALSPVYDHLIWGHTTLVVFVVERHNAEMNVVAFEWKRLRWF